MTNHRRWPHNSLSREKSLNHAYSSDACFCGAGPTRTGPTIALCCIFPKHLIPEYPPQIRRIGGDPDDSQNDSLSRRRPREHAEPCSRTVSSYAEAGRLRPLPIESLRLLPRVPQPLCPARRYQLRNAVRILVPQDEWNLALSAHSREGKNTATFGCDPNASKASATRLSHRNTSFAEEPCGNDGIDAHVEKRWRTSASLHGPSDAQTGSPPFPHNRFENSFPKTPLAFESLCEGVFNNPLENPALGMQTQTDQRAAWATLTALSITTGFPHYHKAYDY